MSPMTAAILSVLGIVEAITLVLVYVLIRRVNALGQSGHSGADQTWKPRAGHLVGDFRLQSSDGREISTRTVSSGTHIAAFVLPGCESCKELVAEFGNGGIDPAQLTVFVASGPADPDSIDLVKSLPAGASIGFIEPRGSIIDAFDILGFPTVIRIEDGAVAAAGLSLSTVRSASLARR